MKAQKRIRSLSKIETFEDIAIAVREGIFPTHLFKMVEAAGEKSPYTFYQGMMMRCKVAFGVFNILYLCLMALAAALIYRASSTAGIFFGIALLVAVMLSVLSDMLPHVPTTRRCIEERFSNFVAFFKELYGRPEAAERKLDADFLQEQVTLAKLMGVIPKDADMRPFIIQTAVIT